MRKSLILKYLSLVFEPCVARSDCAIHRVTRTFVLGWCEALADSAPAKEKKAP